MVDWIVTIIVMVACPHVDIGASCSHLFFAGSYRIRTTLEYNHNNDDNNNIHGKISSTMKLTIAAGTILAQTLPGRVLSDKSVSSHRWTHYQEEGTTKNTAGEDVSQILGTLQKQRKVSTPKSTRTTSARKRISRLLQDRRQSRTLLTNNTSNGGGPSTKACDPLSTDADIGLLSCGRYYMCVANEASRLGGNCVTWPPGIVLDDGYCNVCSHGTGLAQERYDIIIEDTESGYGGKTCRDITEAVYSIGADRCPAVSKAAIEAGCCKGACDLCVIGQKIPEENDNITINSPMAGFENATCGSLWMTSYFYSTFDREDCPMLRQVAKDAGCCAQYECRTCGPRSSIFDDSSDGSKCADLKIAAYLNDTIPSEDCPAAFQLAQDENCCTPVRTYDSCDFCGDATFYPDNWVFKIGSCSYVQSLFSDAFCSQYTPIYAPLCCGPVPEGSAGSSPTSPLSSASTSRSTLVTIMGLTTVAAGALVMNV